MHVIPSGKSNGLVKAAKPPKPSLTSQTPATYGVNGEVELDGNPVESQQEQRPEFAKVYSSRQGYRIDFKPQKVCHLDCHLGVQFIDTVAGVERGAASASWRPTGHLRKSN